MARVEIMTTSDEPDDKKPGKAGKEQRPHATLNLTAEEVPSETELVQAAAGDPEPSPATEDQQHFESDAAPPPDAEPPPFLRDLNLSGIATHMVAGALGAVLALLFGYFLFSRPEPAGFSPEDAHALRAQIGSAETKLAALEQELRKTAERAELGRTASGETEGLKQDMASLAQRLASLEARPATEATPEAVQHSLDPVNAKLVGLEERLESMSKAQSAMRTDGRATALALALYNLRRAANEGRPFAAELKSVAEMSPVPLDLAALETRRDQGVPSLDQLKASFETAASTALEAENQPPGDSFASELWSKAISVIRVRRKGDVPGDSTSAILARIEHRLEGEDLRAALSEAGQLSGPAAEIMAPWLETLKSKLAADEALARVEAKLLTALGGGDTGKRGG
jgi:hypothetical protein